MINNRYLIAAIGLLLTIMSAAAPKVESYRYAPEVQLSRKYAVEVEGIPVSVLTTAEPDYAVFGAKGEVTVKVTCLLHTPDSVIVRPIAKGYP